MTVFDLATFVVGYHLLGGAMYVLYRFAAAVRRESDAETHDLAGLYRPSEYTLPREQYTVVDEPLPVPVAPVTDGRPIPPGEDPLTYYLAPWEVESEPAPLAGSEPTYDPESFTDTWTRGEIARIKAEGLAELIARLEATRDTEVDTTVDTTAIRAEAA